MDTMKDIKIFIYDKEIKKQVMKDITAIIREFYTKCELFILNRGWAEGAHIQVVYKNFENEKAEQDFIKKIYKQAKQWQQLPSETIDYDKYETYVERIKVLENYQGTIKPLQKQFTVKQGLYLKERELFPKRYFTDEKYRTDVVILLSDYFYSLSEINQKIFILKLMTLYGNYENTQLKNDEGIYLAYYSFKSHYEGFINGLEGFSDDKRKQIVSLLQPSEQAERDFIEQGFTDILLSSVSNFENCNLKEKEIFSGFLELIHQLKDSYTHLFTSGAILIKEDEGNTVRDYVSKKGISNYHQKIKDEFNLDLFNQKDFIVGRLIMNWFYSLLPILSISPMKKHKLCNLISLAVEKKKGKQETDLLEELKEKYHFEMNF